MNETEQRFDQIKEDIQCPLKPNELCRINEGIKESIVTIGHSAVIFTAECIACGVKASGWE